MADQPPAEYPPDEETAADQPGVERTGEARVAKQGPVQAVKDGSVAAENGQHGHCLGPVIEVALELHDHADIQIVAGTAHFMNDRIG